MVQLFNRKLFKIHRDFAAPYAADDFLRIFASQQLASRVLLLKLSGNTALEIGAHAGELSSKLTSFDLTVTEASSKLLKLNPCTKQINQDDEELVLEAEQYDLVLSCLNLHWINQVLAFLQKIYFTLKPGGVFLANFIGERSLQSLRHYLIKAALDLGLPAGLHVAPLITKSDITALIRQAGFKDVVTDSEVLEVEYRNILALMRELKQMGQTNKMWQTTGQKINKKLYYALQASNEAFVTNFEIITIYGKK